MTTTVVDDIRKFCRSLPSVTEDVKWGNDLCFSIGGKIFSVVSLTEPFGISFKVPDEEFETLSESEGFMPAPYVARYKWVLLKNANKISKKELLAYIKRSYEMIKAKLPKKILKEL